MRKEYDFSKMKVKRNPYAESLWKAVFMKTESIAKKVGLTEKDIAKAIADYRRSKLIK